MKIISHRGNLSNPDPDLENRPDRIEEVISKGFDCEIDVRMEKGSFLLGHDFGQYKVEYEWLKNLSDYLWIHCKDHTSIAKFTSVPKQTDSVVVFPKFVLSLCHKNVAE